MSVDDWARLEMAEDAADWYVDYEAEAGAGNAFMRGIVHAFSALLSDEVVEAMGNAYHATALGQPTGDVMRALLQAAVRAVTEGESRDDT